MSSAAPALNVDDWNRLNRLLERGLALAVDERALWLQSLPPESAHLRALVAQLLAESEATRFAADTAPPTTVARLATEALAAMRREHVGDRIGPWQLEREDSIGFPVSRLDRVPTSRRLQVFAGSGEGDNPSSRNPRGQAAK